MKKTNGKGDLGEKGRYVVMGGMSLKYIMHDCRNAFMKLSAMYNV